MASKIQNLIQSRKEIKKEPTRLDAGHYAQEKVNVHRFYARIYIFVTLFTVLISRFT